jgi:hypothetical protein
MPPQKRQRALESLKVGNRHLDNDPRVLRNQASESIRSANLSPAVNVAALALGVYPLGRLPESKDAAFVMSTGGTTKVRESEGCSNSRLPAPPRAHEQHQMQSQPRDPDYSATEPINDAWNSTRTGGGKTVVFP